MNNKNRGFTLVEIIIVTAVMLIVILFSYQYLTFSLNSWRSNIGTSNATLDSRISMMHLEKEIRQAFAPPSLPGASGVNVISDREVRIYSYLSNIEKVITYKMDEKDTGDFQMLRLVYNLGDTPLNSDWEVIIHKINPLIKEGITQPFFKVEKQSLIVSFIGLDERGDTRTPVEVINTFRVRSKGAMPL